MAAKRGRPSSQKVPSCIIYTTQNKIFTYPLDNKGNLKKDSTCKFQVFQFQINQPNQAPPQITFPPQPKEISSKGSKQQEKFEISEKRVFDNNFERFADPSENNDDFYIFGYNSDEESQVSNYFDSSIG